MAAFPPSATQTGPGQPPLDTQQQSALAQTLSRVGPPDNPQTKAQRLDPQYQWLAGLHSVRKALDTLLQTVDERPEPDQVLITSMRHAADRLIKGVDGTSASLALASEATAAMAPEIAQMAAQKLDEMNRPPQVPGQPQLAGIMPGGGGPSMGGSPGAGGAPAGPPAAPPPGMGAGPVQPPQLGG